MHQECSSLGQCYDAQLHLCISMQPHPQVYQALHYGLAVESVRMVKIVVCIHFGENESSNAYHTHSVATPNVTHASTFNVCMLLWRQPSIKRVLAQHDNALVLQCSGLQCSGLQGAS